MLARIPRVCYHILPAAFDALKSTAKESMRTQSIVIVVSPLVALMEDQVASFYSKGIRAIRILKEDSLTEDVVDELHAGQYHMLFFSPEGILTDGTWRHDSESCIWGKCGRICG